MLSTVPQRDFSCSQQDLLAVCRRSGTFCDCETGLKLADRDLKISWLDYRFQIRVNEREIARCESECEGLALSWLQVDFCKSRQPLSRWCDRCHEVTEIELHN